jgi:hypothetical protein
MGYNLQVACHTCREQSYALRGEEARVLRRWAQRHPQGHDRDLRVDNGWSGRDDEFPLDYTTVYEELEN